MTNQRSTITRRRWLGSTLAAASGIAAAEILPDSIQAAEQNIIAHPRTQSHDRLLAQDHVVVAERPSPDRIVDDPCLVKLPSGRLLASWTFRGTSGPDKWGSAKRFQLAQSADEGITWERLDPLELCDGMTFVQDGHLYLIGNALNMQDIVITQSADEGKTWKTPVSLFKGIYWNAPTGYAITNGHIYRAFSSAKYQDRLERNSGTDLWHSISVAAGDLSKDLLDPSSWRISNSVPHPDDVPYLEPSNTDQKMTWLEPNVVAVDDRIMVLLRCQINHRRTTNICGICDLTDNGSDLKLQFSQFHPLPGAQCKFHIIQDEPSGLYWMTANPVTDPLNTRKWYAKAKAKGFLSDAGNERRILMLYYGLDGLNWFQAGCIAMSKNPLQSFMYTIPLVAGDDMFVLSRSSRNSENQHNADLLTFHRINDFRSLALDLTAEI